MSKEDKGVPFTLEHQTQKNNSEEMFTVQPVEGTPFSIVKKRGDRDDETDDQYFVVIGNHRLNPEPFDDQEDAFLWAEKITWEKIMQVISIVADSIEKQIAKTK